MISCDKIKCGKQTSYVNSNVKEFDEDTYGVNLFGETMDEVVPERFPHLVQLGNLRVNRKTFGNPQGSRIYSPKGCCPTLHLGYTPSFLIFDDGEYKVRNLSGVESLRLMGVEDDDIQKFIDGGLSNNQLVQLAGNSIVVDVMSELFKNIIRY